KRDFREKKRIKSPTLDGTSAGWRIQRERVTFFMKNNDSDYLNNLRHSCAHLLADAVKQVYPGALNAIGPAIENGFYQDFDMGKWKISEEDFPKIEEKMREILPSWQKFTFNEVTLAEAKKLFKDNKYKVEMATGFAKDGKKLMTNDPGNFLDLCKMGHVDNPSKELTHFKLLSVAGAYWRGSEKNKMLTRIYGTCWPSKKELDDYLALLEEAKKRDHRKLGAELDLFTFSDLVGKGLPLWTAKGATVRRILERFVVDEEIKRGYSHVYTPDIANLELYKTSGHYPYYKDTMYAPITIDEEKYMLRPMTCPHHFELYRSKPRSYRDLPMRIAEVAKLYRYEKSGELTGLMRVRSFCLADSHIIATRDQAASEINNVLDLIDFFAHTFGLKVGIHYRYRLSLGDRKDEKKYFKDDTSWDYAENVLREVLKVRKADYFDAPNEAAFYGPKIDVQMKNIWGKEETAFTVQYDFVMPKRFKLSYIDETGVKIEPIVIHRSSVGAIERTIAFLIEFYAGAFPVWLAPVQVALIPIAERHNEAARKALQTLRDAGLRVELDERNESMQAKIRDATLQKTPYMGIMGDREAANQTISVRSRSGEDLKSLTLEGFAAKLKDDIERKI
ncbi:MAG: threonine--tRNA ligase, partial [Patescibacteria group bacterium]